MEQLTLFQGEGKLEDSKDKAYSTERRQHPRAEVTCPVVIEKSLGLFMSGKTRDISEGGAFITCWEPLQTNEAFQIEFGGAHLDRNMKATAKVIWSDISGFSDVIGSRGMGIRFTELSDDAKRVISDLVSNCQNHDVHE